MASSGVLVLPPARRISGSANARDSAITSSDRPTISINALRMVVLAASRRSSPLRRATIAVTPTLRAKNSDSDIMRGWVGRLTPAMAFLPRIPTIIASIDPIRLDSTISDTEGTAMRLMLR